MKNRDIGRPYWVWKGTSYMSLIRLSRSSAFSSVISIDRYLTATPGRPLVLAALALFVIALGGLNAEVAASPSDKKAIITFSAPVEIPGKALPAGTYVFKLLDTQTNRNIVQVFDKDETHLLATILAIPDYRDTVPDKPIVNFEERPSDTPPSVKALYFPGDVLGLQFVYPHDRAVQLARRTRQNVLSMGNQMTKNMADQDKSADSAGNQELEKTEVTGVDPSGDPVEIVVIVGSEPKK
jgi:hypothetical protein